MKRKGSFFSFLLAASVCLMTSVQAQAPAAAAPAKAAKPTLETFLASANKLFDKLDSYNAILESVADKPTAEAAKLKIDKLVEEYKVVVKEVHDLGEPDAATQKKLEADAKLRTRAQEVNKKMVEVTHKIAALPDALAILKPSLTAFQKVTQEARKQEVGSVTTEPVPAKRQK